MGVVRLPPKPDTGGREHRILDGLVAFRRKQTFSAHLGWFLGESILRQFILA